MKAPPAWVMNAFEGPIVDARLARWGFRHETWIVVAQDGRTSVLQRRADGSDPTSANARAVRDLVRATGLPVPEPRRVVRFNEDVVVVMSFIDGVVGAELLGTERGAEIVGSACGEIGARLGTIDPTGIPLPRTWATGDSLRAATHATIDRLRGALSAETRRRLVLDLDRVAPELDAIKPWLAHGDLVPVNVLMRDDRLAAVLDLDRVQLAHPLYDAAWFTWVVWFYHADVADVAWDAYARAAGVTRHELPWGWMWRLQLLERLAETRNVHERATWAARLASINDVHGD